MSRPLLKDVKLTLRRAALLLTLLTGCVVAPATFEAPAPPADLPARIPLKTPTETFTHEWYLALRDGRLWRRPNPETTGRDEPWALLPPDGRPRHGAGRDGAVITEVGADGLNLIAVDEDGLVFYTKLDDVAWIEAWGLPPRGEPLHAPRERAGLAISHRGPLAGGYEDIDGNFHPISAGVTSLYLLEADGRTLRYADPWLPPMTADPRARHLRVTRVRAGASSAGRGAHDVHGARRSLRTRFALFSQLSRSLDPGLPRGSGRRQAGALVPS